MGRRANTRCNKRRQRRDERGIVLVWMAVVLVVLLGVAAFAVDFGFAYYTGEREQNAADAAALSGALWLPQNCNAANLPAKTRALNVAAANGYTNGAHGGQTKVTVMSHCDAG